MFTDRQSQRDQVQQQIHTFKQLATQDGYDLQRQVVVEQAGQLIHAACFVPNEGGTTFVFFSQPDRLLCDRESLAPYCQEMLREIIGWAFREGTKLLQVLIESDDHSRRDLCLACGFSPLTDLIYLYRDNGPCALTMAPPKNYRWIPYDDSTHELFKEVIAQTYEESLDCPELESVRDMEDVVKAHKASGEFDPKYWNVLWVDGQPVGVLLLSPLRNGDMMELTYMGICKKNRGHGLGLFLLSRALRDVAQMSLAGLMLAVDKRNAPAHQLYLRFGFTELFERSVLICVPPAV